jgi:hypothetical protein
MQEHGDIPFDHTQVCGPTCMPVHASRFLRDKVGFEAIIIVALLDEL